LIAFTFAAQLGLIFWLGEHSHVRPRPPAPAPKLRLVGSGSAQLLALADPSLFALPHRQGFSGPAWLNVAERKFETFDWTESPRWLELPVTKLGAAFDSLIATNQFDSFQVLGSCSAQPALPQIEPPAPLRRRSTLRFAGGLLERRLMTPLDLPSQSNTEVLTNTVVQLVVDAEGTPLSVVLLSGCGSGEADKYALAQATSARFNPIHGTGPVRTDNPMADLSWGEMIFEWHTLPASGPAQ
jgi:hypothetical protein